MFLIINCQLLFSQQLVNLYTILYQLFLESMEYFYSLIVCLGYPKAISNPKDTSWKMSETQAF